MVARGYTNQGWQLASAILLRSTGPAFVAVMALLLILPIFGVPKSQVYDALAIIAGLLTLILFREGPLDEISTRRGLWTTLMSIYGSWFMVVAALLILGYATKTSAMYSRKVLFTWFLATPVLMTLLRIAVDRIVTRIIVSESNSRKVIIAGANQIGRNIAEKIREQPDFAMAIDGFFDDRSAERLGVISEIKILGKLNELPDYVRQNNVDLIFISLPIRNVQRVTELLDALHDTTASIYYVPDVFVFDLINCRTTELDGMPVVSLCETPFYGSRGLAKRLSDIFIASIIILLTSPLLLLISLLVKVTSKGSVIFTQRRYGLDGQEISVFKFRSMTVSEDGDVVKQATKDDHRLTPIGAFLRKYSLDEFPQFFNVLQGRMSVVGPRPHAVVHNEEYRRLIKGYMIRHKVKPGITGLAQIRGYRGETINVEDMRNRIESDLEYLRNWSLGLDIRIILRTVGSILSDKSAY